MEEKFKNNTFIGYDADTNRTAFKFCRFCLNHQVLYLRCMISSSKTEDDFVVTYHRHLMYDSSFISIGWLLQAYDPYAVWAYASLIPPVQCIVAKSYELKLNKLFYISLSVNLEQLWIATRLFNESWRVHVTAYRGVGTIALRSSKSPRSTFDTAVRNQSGIMHIQ